jgi:hypothetical protein
MRNVLWFVAGSLTTLGFSAVAQLTDGATIPMVKVVDFTTRQELTQCYAAMFMLDGHAILCMRPSKRMNMDYPLPPKGLRPLPDPTK